MLFLLISTYGHAQHSDSLIVSAMSQEGITFSSDNSVRLLMSGREKFADMFEVIRQAKSSIHMEYFNFRNDSIANLLYDLLREKRRQGVEVRCLFDGFGNDSNNQPLKKEHLQRLHADSIEIYEFDPIRFPWVNHIWPRDHRKIVVIDGRIGYTGGMNVADYYIVGTEQVGEWRDMHCRIEGPAVNQLQAIFIRMWKRVTKEELTDPKYFQAVPAGNKTVGIANREPHISNEIMRRFYIQALDNAHDSVKIVNPYFAPTPSVMKALKRCAERGVKMDILISSKYDIPLMPDVVHRRQHESRCPQPALRLRDQRPHPGLRDHPPTGEPLHAGHAEVRLYDPRTLEEEPERLAPLQGVVRPPAHLRTLTDDET